MTPRKGVLLPNVSFHHDLNLMGVLSDLEATMIKRFKCGAGIGVIGSWIEQVSYDSGPTAVRFNGFRGRAFGAGPIVTTQSRLERVCST